MATYIKQEVKIYHQSIEHLNIIDTYGYTECKNELEEINGSCIIHISPKKDTFIDDNKEDLIGYCDSIMFDMTVFDVDNRIYYKSDSLYDSIVIENIKVQSRIYKDLSTMYMFNKPIHIMYGENTVYIDGFLEFKGMCYE